MLRLLSFVLLLLALQPAKAQTDNFKKQLCKAWSLQYVVVNDQKLPLDPEQASDQMVFLENNTVKTIDASGTETAKWSYDPAKKVLTLTDEATKEKVFLTIIKLDNNSFVLSMKEDGDNVVMHLAPVKAK